MVGVTTKVLEAMATITTTVDMEGIVVEIATLSNTSNLPMEDITISGTTLTMVVVVGTDRISTMGRSRRSHRMLVLVRKDWVRVCSSFTPYSSP
jgi:hypothetical protein